VNSSKPSLAIRVRRLAKALTAAGLVEQAQDVVIYIRRFGVPLKLEGQRMEVKETDAGVLVAIRDGEVVATEDGGKEHQEYPPARFVLNSALTTRLAQFSESIHVSDTRRGRGRPRRLLMSALEVLIDEALTQRGL
jgi:GNAT superfamily N-acetyltransferase